MRKTILCAGIVLLVSSMSHAGQIWQSTFATGPDGVADIYDNNPEKVMLGSAGGGTLQVTTQDPGGAGAYTPDKAGRATGTTLGSSNSFSALYRFDWSHFSQSASQVSEFVGFLGNATPQTRQVLGVIMRHWHPTATDYYTAVDLAFGSVGITSFGYQAGGATYLGTTNPETGEPFQLAIGYDGTSHTLTADLYDGSGNLLTEHSSPLEGLGMTPSSGAASEIADMALNNVGWSDYTYNATDQTTGWNEHYLGFYDTADGAKLAAATVPEPVSLGLLAMGGAALLRRRRWA